MIYGIQAKSFTKDKAKILSELENRIKWPGSFHFKIVFENFNGGLFFDSNVPYSINDFYFISPEANILILLSGRIYNKTELLSNNQITKVNISDAELIFYLYTLSGPNFINKLNGDFVIFIIDVILNESFLIRDHVGVRPVAYHLSGNNTLWFSSDSIVLCKTLFHNEPIDQNFINNALVNHALQSHPLLPDYSLMPNKKIKKVFPGHYLNINQDSASEIKYWTPESNLINNKLEFNEAFKNLKYLVEDAVKIRCDKKFYASAHISGGIDSATVAGLARKEFADQESFYGFSWSPSTKPGNHIEYNESELINGLCNMTGIIPVFTEIGVKEYIDFLSCDRYTTDLYYEPAVRRYAKNKRINLIFSGYGGDEFISLNNIGIDSDLIFGLKWGSFIKKNLPLKPKKFIKALLFNVLLPALKLRYYSIKKPLYKYSKYLLPFSKEKAKTINDLYYWKSRHEIHEHWLYDYHLQERMEDWSVNGFREGVEYRFPLIDKRIVEFMFQVPSKLLFSDCHSRIMLRKIGDSFLPKNVIWSESKNDPLRMDALYNLADDVCEHLFDEIPHFKKNPVFGIINFKLLEDDIAKYKRKELNSRPYELFDILFFIKKIHEYTNAYYR